MKTVESDWDAKKVAHYAAVMAGELEMTHNWTRQNACEFAIQFFKEGYNS